jgi:hypothetical protein
MLTIIKQRLRPQVSATDKFIKRHSQPTFLSPIKGAGFGVVQNWLSKKGWFFGVPTKG